MSSKSPSEVNIYFSKPLLTSVRAIMLLPILVIASLAFHGVSVAEPPPFYWEFINVDIDVQENGDMLITETQKYVFTGPYTNERYRYIPLDKVDRIDSVQFFEKGVERPVTSDVKNNQFWIRWRHTLNPPESHTFILKYRVIGGLRMMMPNDHLNWEAILGDRPAPIQRAKVTVRLPDQLAGVHLRSKAFGVPATTRMVDTQTVEFVPRGPLPPGKGLQVQVVFPHGLLGLRDLPRGIGVDLDSWILELALLIVLGAGFLLLFARRMSGAGTMSWECGCGIVNKDSTTVCRGCTYPKGYVQIDVWEQLSREIGGEFVEQEEAGFKIGPFRTGYKLVAKFKNWTFTLYEFPKSRGGLYGGFDIYTVMTVPYVNKDDFQFTIYRKTEVSGLGKLFGMQDIEVGHPELDHDFIIKSNSVPKVRALLANPVIRGLIRAQPHIHFQSVASILYYERIGQSRRGSIEDVQNLKSLFDLFVETLNQLVIMGSASEEPPIIPPKEPTTLTGF